MVHPRTRHLMPLFFKRLKIARVVAMQGCRQAGKSYFAQHWVTQKFPSSRYVTFDERAQKSSATDRPDVFLEQASEHHPLIIDEAQKVPEIFDAVKFRVDKNPRVGQYILLGSTEFSRLVKIRETLTGRMSRLRLYTLNLAECYQLPLGIAPLNSLLHTKPRFARSELLKHLNRGGLPGIFGVRSEGAAQDLLRDWLDLTTQRDFQQFTGGTISGEFAFDVLNQLAQCDDPTAHAIAKKLRVETRLVQKTLDRLTTLFVVHSVPPYKLGTGKPLYFLCDVSLVTYFKGSFERQIQTWALHEQLSQRSYRDDREYRVSYYRTTKGSVIDFVIEKTTGQESVTAIKLILRERFDQRDFEVLHAFKKKCEQNTIAVHIAAMGPITTRIAQGLEMYSWESLG